MTKAKINAHVAVECVPWQLCPRCLGTGKISGSGFTSSVWEVCPVCKGAMIIPMFVLPTDVCPKCGQFKTTAGNGILRQLCECD